MFDTFNHSKKTVSQPSYSVLAVTSEILSIGVYASIFICFLKSLIA